MPTGFERKRLIFARTSTATIEFEGVSKKFRRAHHHSADEDLWAVRDVSFRCEEGEVVGLVGRNGCGKSTLLKLAAGVTSPTFGKVTTIKPIAPMLELGAGFHPDLTGRDNIRLNGSLLGMGRHLSAAKMDEIIVFAELEAHVDTPVKHFSSGMSARLGFAVAVHSPARLLLVDEVLSVGDKLFQQKCLERMRHLRDQGTTIMLVSHDDWWIRNFCTRAIVIEQGRLVEDSKPDQALRAYDLQLFNPPSADREGLTIGPIEVSGSATIHERADGPQVQLTGSSVCIRFAFDARKAFVPWLLSVRVRREDGIDCALCVAETEGNDGHGIANIEMTDLNLVVGQYWLEASIEDASTLTPLATRASETLHVFGPFDERRGFEGVMKVQHRWTFG